MDLWNGAIDHKPARVLRPRSAAEVAAAVRDRGDLPVSVRGGGHDWAGRAVRDGGLVIDLRDLNTVDIDPERRIATIGGGATTAEVIAAAAAYGLAAAAGNAGSVGFTGLTLGGGYGPLSGLHGLALDNLLGAEVVLADGRIVQVDAEHEPELFWAIRGGGGNFGVVTSTRVEVHPVEQMLAGFMFFAWDEAPRTWARLEEYLRTAPDGLTVQSGVLSAPDGSPTLLVYPVWVGDMDEGARQIENLKGLGTALMTQVEPTTYGDALKVYDSLTPAGRHASIRTRSFASLTPDVVDALVRTGEKRTSPFSGTVVHQFHGAATRVPAEATAFANREPHFVAEIVSLWEPEMPGDHVGWTEDTWLALEPYAMPGGYVNLIGPDQAAQADAAYGGNTARLLAAKRTYDPEGVFSATSLPRG
ncbi:FAD/FMN-containing dehydrogenase [Micromonospora pisi]|uniref:FAD/FMN-containing dehydrogenase n=1 Tax=Micromonospora pisi TaxID=589240 RepID=A0A495JGG0_9ACTN|nr:FAD-binding protein [Micromonospora pisi]RKR87432.1 FAD/FMN-containing dehydrogenase [Micromonospora pisi]